MELAIERVVSERLTDVLPLAGVAGYPLLPGLGGSGRSGEWSRSGQVSQAGGMVQVICVVRPEKVDHLLEAAFKVVERHIGIVSVTDCEVLRAERF